MLSALCVYVYVYTFIGLWLSVVVLPKTPALPAPNPELEPNKLIVSY